MARLPVAGPVVIPNCGEVKVNFIQQNEICSIVCHGNLTAAGPLNPGIAETIFSALKAAAGTTAFMGAVDPSCSMTGVTVKDLRAANNPTLESSGLALVGTGTGGPTPQGSALVITKKTAQAGKQFTGRAYLFGLTTTELANSRSWAAGAGQLGVGFMNALNAAMTASALPMVIAQRALQAGTTASGAALPARTAGVVPVTSFVARDLRIDSQRRRLGR